MQNIIEKNNKKIKVSTMPNHTEFISASHISIDEIPKQVRYDNDEVINEPLSSFSPKQKQTIMKIFKERDSMLENLSK